MSAGNQRELRLARKKAQEAADELAAIEALPRRRGSTVTWSNGIVWTREGDDAWRPHDDADPDYEGPLYPSAHVAAPLWALIVETSGA